MVAVEKEKTKSYIVPQQGSLNEMMPTFFAKGYETNYKNQLCKCIPLNSYEGLLMGQYASLMNCQPFYNKYQMQGPSLNIITSCTQPYITKNLNSKQRAVQ